jgi:hypothetical protein
MAADLACLLSAHAVTSQGLTALNITWGPADCVTVPESVQQHVAYHIVTFMNTARSLEGFLDNAATFIRQNCRSIGEAEHDGHIFWRSSWYAALFQPPLEPVGDT